MCKPKELDIYMAQSDLYYKKTTNTAQTVNFRTQLATLLSPERTEIGSFSAHDHQFTEGDARQKTRTLESGSNSHSPKNQQAMRDYVGAYNISHSPLKKSSPSMSPTEMRVGTKPTTGEN